MEEPFITRTDPYSESKPINDPTWFYGHDIIMRNLREDLAQGNHIGLFGLRKVAKTSLVKQVQNRFLPTPTVFIDCQAFSPRSLLYLVSRFRNSAHSYGNI